MSWEEDYLMRRVGELTAILKGHEMLNECAECTTLFAADLDVCPNCQTPVPGTEAAVEPEQAEEDVANAKDGEPVNDYADQNVEQLKQELSDRNVFYPGNAKRADLVALLQENDRAQSSEAEQV